MNKSENTHSFTKMMAVDFRGVSGPLISYKSFFFDEMGVGAFVITDMKEGISLDSSNYPFRVRSMRHPGTEREVSGDRIVTLYLWGGDKSKNSRPIVCISRNEMDQVAKIFRSINAKYKPLSDLSDRKVAIDLFRRHWREHIALGESKDESVIKLYGDRIKNDCFLCEYVSRKHGVISLETCKSCPILWPSLGLKNLGGIDTSPCEQSLYGAWRRCHSKMDSSSIAVTIASLPERAD